MPLCDSSDLITWEPEDSYSPIIAYWLEFLVHAPYKWFSPNINMWNKQNITYRGPSTRVYVSQSDGVAKGDTFFALTEKLSIFVIILWESVLA